MRVKTIVLDEIEITLRLTASGLAAYAEAIGSGGNVLFAVMDALDDLRKQGRLFTAALTYKGHNNTVTDGFDLIDMLAEAGYDPVQKKELIVELAEKGGVIGKVDAVKVLAAIKAGNEKLYDAAVAILSGNADELEAAHREDENPAENPT